MNSITFMLSELQRYDLINLVLLETSKIVYVMILAVLVYFLIRRVV